MTTETKHMPSEREIEAAAKAICEVEGKSPYPPGNWNNWTAHAKAALTAASQFRAPDQSERIRELEAELAEADRRVARARAFREVNRVKPVAWLRDARPDAEDEALVVCNRIDPGAFPVFASSSSPASQVLTEEIDQHIGWLKNYIGVMSDENWRDMKDYAERQLIRLSSAIDRLTNKDAEHG